MKLHPSVAAAALLLAASSTAQAQTPQIYCGPGAPFCFAMKTAFTPYTGLEVDRYATTFTVYLQNLQGSWQSTAAPAFLNTFRISRNNGPADSPFGLPDLYLVVGANQAPFAVPVGNAQAGNDTFASRDDCITETCTAARFTFGFQGIAGCAVAGVGSPFPPEEFFAVRTCPSQGVDGWARMEFSLGLLDGFDPSADPIEVDADMFVFTVSDENFTHSCFFGGDQAGLGDSIPHCTELPYVVPTVSPEPATLALVGSGLLGVIGLGWRRRKA